MTITLLGSKAEHAVEFYDDNTGYGRTMCGAKICPLDSGMHVDEKPTCRKCKTKMKPSKKGKTR